MTTRIFSNPYPQFLLSDGTPNASGYIYFYEPGAGNTTAKAAYSDSDYSVELLNPLPLDLNGFPSSNIYLNGDYRIVIKTAGATDVDRVVIRDIPNYQAPELDAQFQDWAANITYSINDFVRGSNGKYYQSIGNDNKGNDPVSSTTKWVEIYFIDVWSGSKTYAMDDIVKYGDDLWVSQVSSNLGNTPSVTSSSWRSFFEPSIVTNYTAASFEYRNSDGYNTTRLDIFGGGIGSAAFESIGPTSSGAANIWAAMDDMPAGSKLGIFRVTWNAVRDVSADDSLEFYAYARQTGGAALTSNTIIADDVDFGGSTTAEAAIRGSQEFIVPVDSSNRFDFYYQLTNADDNEVIELQFVGYKI